MLILKYGHLKFTEILKCVSNSCDLIEYHSKSIKYMYMHRKRTCICIEKDKNVVCSYC